MRLSPSRFSIPLACWLLCNPAAGQGLGDYEVDWEFIGEQAHALGNKAAKHFELPFELPPPGDWKASLGLVEKALKEGSLSDLARLAPYARQARQLLADYPQAEPYVDWLMQRLDYLDIAEEEVRRAPTPPQATHRPPANPGSRPPTTRPPSPPPSRESSGEAWKKKVAKRPQPRGAAALVPRVKPEFQREGVPPELVWLAEVESSFNPEARSPVGAKGLFQFMPATARHMGLQTAPVDERTHPEKSARAAAQYLRYLHGRFNDWPLALAAYNAGEGRVGKLARLHGHSFESIAPHLPAETRMYVPKVLATVSLREGIDAGNLPPPRPRG